MQGPGETDRRPPPPEAPPRIPFRRRSRVVAWAKVLLPLAALALLSTLFLLARAPGGPVDIPFARIEEIAREPRMDRPRLSGVAEDGTTLALAAERITPVAGRADAFALAEPRLETRSPEGGGARLEAASGEVDGPTRRLRLEGGVRLEAERGIVVETPGLTADLASGTLVAGPVTAVAPFGEIEAGGMTLEQGNGNGARLVFNRGVRLLYLPERPPPAEAP
jgi:lipopolysaccharide export system protein LptC